jgi:hypothetical protein
MQIQCLKAETIERGGESETIVDLLLVEYGLVIRDLRFVSDRNLEMGSVILPREMLIEGGKPATRDVFLFTDCWEESAFVAKAVKAILAFQGNTSIGLRS